MVLDDQPGPEPANNPLAGGDGGVGAGAPAGVLGGGACGGEAGIASGARGGDAGIGAGAGTGAAAAAEELNADGTGGAGAQRATRPKDRVSHSTNLELSPARHQWAPVAKKKTWIAIHSVRKNRWATTMPRHRAAISLQSAAIPAATASTAAAMPNQNPLSGACPPRGGEGDGIGGGCGTNATVLPSRNYARILVKKSKL